MATETRVRLRSSSIEGATIPILGATLSPTGLCPLAVPDETWYGGPGLTDHHLVYIVQYFPVSVEDAVPNATWAFNGGFIGNFPWAISVDINHTHPPASARNAFVRETFAYFERGVDWDGAGIKLTIVDQDLTGGWGWEVRESTVPLTRDETPGFAEGGWLYDYGGAPHTLGFNEATDVATLYPPVRTGSLLWASGPGVNIGDHIFVSGPMSCRLLVFISTLQDPLLVAPPWEPFVTLNLEVGV